MGSVSASASTPFGGSGEFKLEATTIEGGAVELENTIAVLVCAGDQIGCAPESATHSPASFSRLLSM